MLRIYIKPIEFTQNRTEFSVHNLFSRAEHSATAEGENWAYDPTLVFMDLQINLYFIKINWEILSNYCGLLGIYALYQPLSVEIMENILINALLKFLFPSIFLFC